jgi:hypothetical protein
LSSLSFLHWEFTEFELAQVYCLLPGLLSLQEFTGSSTEFTRFTRFTGFAGLRSLLSLQVLSLLSLLGFTGSCTGLLGSP